MSAAPPQPVSALRGLVVSGSYATGSKSERQAVFIQTARGQFILRRKVGPVFGDAELNALIGQEVECQGFLLGTTLLAERIELVK